MGHCPTALLAHTAHGLCLWDAPGMQGTTLTLSRGAAGFIRRTEGGLEIRILYAVSPGSTQVTPGLGKRHPPRCATYLVFPFWSQGVRHP